MNDLYQEYTEYLRKVSHLRHTMNVLDIDSLLSLGERGHDVRAEQMGILGELIHSLLTDEKYVQLLSELERSELGTTPRRNVEVSVQDFIRMKKLPTAFVKECQVIQSMAEVEYRRAKKEKDFSIFAPHLEKLVAMKQKEAEYLGVASTVYDVHLDQYDPGLTQEYLDPLFARIKSELLPIVRKLYNLKQDIPDLIIASLETRKNRELFHYILGEMGYDTEA